MSLKSESLLQSHYFEAGLPLPPDDELHGGWDSLHSYIRGHYLGHWLSAAAKLFCSSNDREMQAKADWIVAELSRCQAQNGDGWAGSLPEKYLSWLAEGMAVRVPHYVLHKTLMGLWDMYAYTGNDEAFAVLERWADWFVRFTASFSDAEMDRMMETETGGMLEVWADLYGATHKPEHLTLMQKYERRALFNRLLAGEDALTNIHANTTLPEVLGAARAYEVTGEDRYRRIVESYWRCAVGDRGYFCTGNPTSEEVYCPPECFPDRLGHSTQEHCTVYNLIRLAGFLYRWTGEAQYADYIERCLYNGTLAQQNLFTGMPAYFLSLAPGARKRWGTPTDSFWCCSGTVAQAQASYEEIIYYTAKDDIVVAQYIPSVLETRFSGVDIRLTQTLDPRIGDPQGEIELDPGDRNRPQYMLIRLAIHSDRPVTFPLRFRLPWWLAGNPEVLVNDIPADDLRTQEGYGVLVREWQDDHITLRFPKQVTVCPLPGDPSRIAFMDGPAVLVGLCADEKALCCGEGGPASILAPYSAKPFGRWSNLYITKGQTTNIVFQPIHEIVDETYTTYFPITQL